MCCSVKRLTYGYEGGVPVSCFKHRDSKMVLITLKCDNKCNVKVLNYNFRGLKYGIKCGKHKDVGMVDITKVSSEEKKVLTTVPRDDAKQEAEFWPNEKPSEWLLSRVNLSFMDSPEYHQAVVDLPFIYSHVGGSGKTTPPRGVCTVGGREKVKRTWWTASQNRSDVTLESETLSYPDEISSIIPSIVDKLRDNFPEAPISEDTFLLAVANHYQVGTQNKISPHTDDQPWYASPPFFASITTFPDGEPHDYRATFRFQVLDEGVSPNKFVDLYLRHSSVCIMRADITHRVLPPISSLPNHKARYNLTFRNIVSSELDPLGFIMAMSNHYRYYGKPMKMLIPEGTEEPEDLIERYRELNPQLKVFFVPVEDKKLLRKSLIEYYKANDLRLNLEMLSKSNVTSSCIKWVLN
jgi:hypothetical protein